VSHASGVVQTIACASALIRALWIISLAGQPVTLRCEDLSVAAA